MKKVIWSFVFAVLFLSACSSGTESEDFAFLEVELSIAPEEAQLEESVLFEALVTYGGQPVKDADEVRFEIWRSQSENHEVFEVEHAGEGLYKLEQQFWEEGTYYIYAHVTAEGMHSMPKKEFVVGEPSAPETKENSSSNFMNEGEKHNH